MKHVAVQINGPRNCPAWQAIANKHNLKTTWLSDPVQLHEVCNADLIILQHFTQTVNLDQFNFTGAVIGSCGDAASVTNLDAAFHNLPKLTELYVDGHDYLELYQAMMHAGKAPKGQIDKLKYRKTCADSLFQPLASSKLYDWCFIGQVYPAYEQRLNHDRNRIVAELAKQFPAYFIGGSKDWSIITGLDCAGWMPQNELNSIYARSHLILSVDAHHGTGYTSTRPIEVMHAGHCVVMYDHAGMPYFKQFVKHEEQAFYFKTADDFGKCLDFVKSDRLRAEDIGKAARQVILVNGWTHSQWLESLVERFVISS